jgi:deazaflavin-dependent oxidoreductase (nitroreductase family)
MSKKKKPGFLMRIMGKFIVKAIQGGQTVQGVSLLIVKGRKSGEQRSVPVSIVEWEGKRYVIAAYGETNWVKNLRAAGEAIITTGPEKWRVRAHELNAKKAAPILQRSIQGSSKFVQSLFDATPDSPLSAFELEAKSHPVFQLDVIGTA